jgi:CRISPR-associated endonuclease/helicase Cas3
MLFSSLVDADFLDTEAFMQPQLTEQRVETYDLGRLKAALDSYMETLTASATDTPVNRVRREILEACRAAAQRQPGLFSLTVPTGGGKTLASMSFALDHAVAHRKSRIIYVIPYTSIIEQTGAILSSIFGPEVVVEHHSNLDPEKETPRTKLASENWEAPIILTTNVQFFESLFAARPSRCRKLHNIVNSVVILDEAQLVPPNLLAPCVAAINELCDNYGVTLVLSTATQPTLPSLRTPSEITPPGADLYIRLKRTEILVPAHFEERSSWEEIASQLTAHEQVLCIVNSRRDCYDLYQLMPPGTLHLSALMCGEHRSCVIATIKERLGKGEPLRVISTQLVEAGVDIDFPVVFRALAGLDSIAQAAGRCNREGKKGVTGKVMVFIPPRSAPHGLLHKGECTTKELRALPDFNPHAPESYRRYFDLFYSRINDIGQSYLDRLTPSDTRELDVAFRTVGDTFRLIVDRAQRSVFVRYGAGESLLRELQFAGPRRELMRRLQRYTVNVPARLADSMLRDGLIEEIRTSYFAQCSLSVYKDDIGLDVFQDTLPIDDLTGV